MVDGKLHEAITSTTAGEDTWQMGSTWNWKLIEVRDTGGYMTAVTNPIYRQRSRW